MVKEYSHEELERMRIAMQGESAWDKMKRKSKEEPLVPAGKNHESATPAHVHFIERSSFASCL